MEAKRIIIFTLLRAGFKKTKMNVSWMTIQRVEQRLKASEFIKNHPQSGRSQVISQDAFKNVFEYDPCQKMTRLAQEKKIRDSTEFRMVKEIREKRLRLYKKPLLSVVMIQKRLERSTRWLNDLKSHGNRILIFSHKKTITADSVFNKQNIRVVTFINTVVLTNIFKKNYVKNYHNFCFQVKWTIWEIIRRIFLQWFFRPYHQRECDM